MSYMSNCKECPWVIRNKHNDNVINFSKRMNKPRNCHMVSGGKDLWNVNESTMCSGRKKYERDLGVRTSSSVG